MEKVSGVYGGGYSDGVGAIASADDIQYRSPVEKTEFEREVSIIPPAIIPTDAGFLFHFYSWENKTSMEVLDNTLEWDPEEGVKFKWKVVKYNVGLPDD